MDTLILPKTKILLSAAAPLKKILSPLYKLTDLALFSYVRIYYDNGLIDICDRAEVIESVYYDNKNLYLDLPPDICPDLLLNEYLLMSCQNFDNPSLKYLCQDAGLSDVLVITKKSQYYYENFWFGGKEHSRFINFCINNLNTLESFIRYFKSNNDAISLINKCEQDRMFRSTCQDTQLRNEEFIAQYKQDKNKVLIEPSNVEDDYKIFCNRLKNRYNFRDKTTVYLTQRETECFYWCAQGKTSEETAIILQVSKKTVENHLNNLKQKLNFSNKAALIRQAFSWGLF